MAIGDGVGREVLVQQVLLLISHIFGWVKYKRVLSTLLNTDAFERDGIGTEMPDSLSVDDVSLISIPTSGAVVKPSSLHSASNARTPRRAVIPQSARPRFSIPSRQSMIQENWNQSPMRGFCRKRKSARETMIPCRESDE